MKLINTENGHLNLINGVEIKPDAGYEELKQQLKQNNIEFLIEEQYNLLQWVHLKNIKADNKTFHLEIYFDNKKLKSVNMGFECDEGHLITYEQWLENITGGQSIFGWGKAEAREHPKFGVPLIGISYK